MPSWWPEVQLVLWAISDCIRLVERCLEVTILLLIIEWLWRRRTEERTL